MKDQEFKDIWQSLEDFPGVPIGKTFDKDSFIKFRSITVNDKVRKIMRNDLLLKLFSGILFILNMIFYYQTTNVIYVCLSGLVFLALMSFIEYKVLKHFNSIDDQSKSTKQTLSDTLIFLQRKSNILGILNASSQILFFVPGVLAYFFIFYGYLKPMTAESYFVFSTLCLISTIMAYIRIMSQVKHYIKHITLCMSDLNDNILQMAYSAIEKERKQDYAIITLVGLLSIFVFVALIAVLKSVMG